MRKIQILWAEDNKATYKIYSEKLKAFLIEKDLDAEISWAVDGNAVFRFLYTKERRFDLLITDIEMPYFNGISTVVELKKQHPGLPMIIVSRLTESETYASRLNELLERKVIDGFFSLDETAAWFVAARRLMTIAPNILHLSDIHFGSDHAFQGRLKIVDLMKKLLKNIAAVGKIDLVIVSGDLTSRGTEKEFEKAEEFLISIAEELRLGLDRFVIVPGNHDIYRGEEEGRRFLKFIEFLDSFHGRDPSRQTVLESYPELYDAERVRLHWEGSKHSEESLYRISIYDELQTVVVGLNSVIASGDQSFDLSKVEPTQLLKISERLDALTYPQSDYFRMAVFHHNPLAVPSFTSEGELERLVRNPTFVLNELIRNGVSLLFHGHAHYAIGYEIRPIFMTGDRLQTKRLHVFGAGTLSGKDLQIAQSSYNLTVMQFQLNDSGRISSALVHPYRLKDDSLDWESVPPEEIRFL